MSKLTFGTLVVAALVFQGCQSTPPSGGESAEDGRTFYGSTFDQNRFGFDIGEGEARVLVLMAAAADSPYDPTPTAIDAYRLQKSAKYAPIAEYWSECSYTIVGADLDWKPELQELPWAFDDYFEQEYVRASLTTKGLAESDLVTDGASARLQIQDGRGRRGHAELVSEASYGSLAALVADWRTALENITPATSGFVVPEDWVTCHAVDGEIRFELGDAYVNDAAFLRVRDGSHPKKLGLKGPVEKPGGNAPASLAGLSVFPTTLVDTVELEIEVRDKNKLRRTYPFTIAAGTSINTGSDLAAMLLPALNSEFDWVSEQFEGVGRLGLRLKPGHSDPSAAIRVVTGMHTEQVGLDGPVRVDGVVNIDDAMSLRAQPWEVVSHALSAYVQRRAIDAGITVDAANEGLLDAIANELHAYDAFMVVFADELVGAPTGRRGYGLATEYYDVRVPGAGDYEYFRQYQAGFMIGPGSRGWKPWAESFGHVLGFRDLDHRLSFDELLDENKDYVNEWGLMGDPAGAAHVVGWHKESEGWLSRVVDVGLPGAGEKLTRRFVLAPLDRPLTKYASLDSEAAPLAQLVRVRRSASRSVNVTYRKSGKDFSQLLPDATGAFPPEPGAGGKGGVLVTDAYDPFVVTPDRPSVAVLNPHGSGADGRARGLVEGQTLDLADSSIHPPQLKGDKIRVIEKMPVEGALPAMLVEVERQSQYVDLEIRPWHAPDTYGTPDIWLDWGDPELYPPPLDPPVGAGDKAHWHDKNPDAGVTNLIRVRVHNRGNTDATGVEVEARIAEYRVDNAFEPLDTPPPPTQTIPAGESRDFAFAWLPTKRGHFCVETEVVGHTTEAPESDTSNNISKENITSFRCKKGSPYAPELFSFIAKNEDETPARFLFLPSRLHPNLEISMERSGVQLAPGAEERVFVEIQLRENVPPQVKYATFFNMVAWKRTGDSWDPFGGFTAEVYPTIAANLDEPNVTLRLADDGQRSVLVSGKLEGERNTGQAVDVALSAADGKAYEGSAITDAWGVYQVVLADVPAGKGDVMVYYFGYEMEPAFLGPFDVAVP